MWKLVFDLAAAVAAYLAGWSLQFSAHQPDLFPPPLGQFSIVVVTQLFAIASLRTYRSGSTSTAARRFVVGVVIGTIVGAAIAIATYGRGSIPLSALAADAWLLALAGVLWRCGVLAALPNQHLSASPVDTPEGMYAIGGPRPILKSFRDLARYRTLVNGLVARDLKLKYRGSVLGFFWSLLNPLVMVAVYTVVFTFLMPQQQPGFVLRLLVGLLAWGLFANSAMMATGTVVDSGGLIKSIYFPRSILPLSTVLFNLSLYLLTLAVFVPVLFLYYGIVPSSAMLAFPVFLGLQVIFTIGVSLALAATTTIFRDIKHLTEISLSMLFWLTPIIYAVPDMKPSIRVAILLSPMSSFVVAYQRMFHEQQWPAPHLWGLAIFFACTSILVGATLFSALEPRFGEQV
jgi:ABC-type polysaccharide/polyol phosphate export permease